MKKKFSECSTYRERLVWIVENRPAVEALFGHMPAILAEPDDNEVILIFAQPIEAADQTAQIVTTCLMNHPQPKRRLRKFKPDTRGGK